MDNISRAGVAVLHIADLPDGLLVGISSYLAKPSAVLFAMAMMDDSDQQTQTSKAIISSIDWSVLDFSDIEKSLAAKLSDGDIDKILKSIDAASCLKILKLAGCINITGSGLDLLRSSVAIQQIDLSLVGKHEVPLLDPEPILSEDIVIPIIDDIIGRGRGSTLKQLELPKKWRRSESTEMEQFFVRYDDYLTNQRFCCSKCEQVIDTDNNDWVCLDGDEWHGSQNFTCSGCLNHFCYGLFCAAANGNSTVNWCKKCEKGYCKSCAATYSCRRCEQEFCNECKEMKTCEGECETTFCDDCFEKSTCSFCGRCNACSAELGSVFRCSSSHCEREVCSECFFSRSREVGGSRCECGGSLEEIF